MVIYPPLTHLHQRVQRHVGCDVFIAQLAVKQQKEQIVWGRELGRLPEATVIAIIDLPELHDRHGKHILLGTAGCLLRLPQIGDDLLSRMQQCGAVVLPLLGNLQQQFIKAGHAAAGSRREIGSGKKRLSVRGQKQACRPAAAASHGLTGGHIDLVDIRPLFTIHLDADKMLVQ